MKKLIAAAAVVAAAAGSLLGFAGHASAASLTVVGSGGLNGVCLTVSWDFPDPSSMLPVGLPVALPIPFAGSQSQCLPPDLPAPPGVPGLPVSPPSLPV